MGEIFRELQEESKERETRGAFERWLTEKRGTPLLLEQTQAYEAFKAGMKHYGCMTAVRMFQAEEAALAQPETAVRPCGECILAADEVCDICGANGTCDVPPMGWRCTRSAGHDGPCATVEAPEQVDFVNRGMDRLRDVQPPEDAMFSRGAVAAIVAGAIYDFAGFMTTRSVSVSVGASEACGPVVDLITSFAEKRGLDLEEAAVQSWNLCIGRDVQPPTEGA